MKPRIFCREDRYPRVLALTYSFDPLFFERIIMKDLNYGGSTDITIVGDRNELQEAVTRYAGQFNFLGKSYLLAPANTRKAFHPKLLLRMSDKGALLMFGSGNLTFGGWGGNHELACELTLGANQLGSAAIVNHVLDHVAPYLDSEVGKNSLARLRDYPWLAVADETTPNILMTTPDEPLADQLQRRWAGRRFDSMKVLTGSTDERGAFITWCHKQFGVEECVVAVSPENSSFIKEDVAKCPVKVSLAPFSGGRMLHAKFYWFDGPDGPAAIVGSANCSSAAWLISPIHGGNVEIVQVHDTANAQDFAEILSSIPENQVAVEKTRPTENVTEEEAAPAYYVKAMHLYRNQGFVDVVLSKSLPEMACTSLIGPTGIEIELIHGDNGVFSGQAPETIEWPTTTCLAKVKIVTDGEVLETPLHWLDDMDAITQAAHIKPPAEPFKNLPRSSTSSEHDKVVSDLATISASIFTDSAAYLDPPKRKVPNQPNNDESVHGPVKPEDLVKSLNDLEAKGGERAMGSGSGMYLSMTGVMRALFEEVETSSMPEDENKTSNPDGPEGDPPTPVKSKENSKLQEPKTRELPADRHKKKLREDLDKFFDKFSSKNFASDCTVSKLVQAAAYPLSVSLLGERGGWLDQDESRAIATRVVDILLNRNLAGKTERGLLEEVYTRYQENERKDIFRQVIGDGTLWVVLLAVLAQISWEQDLGKFERAINLHRVYSCDLMRADTTLGKLTTLVTRLDVERAHDLIGKDAPQIAEAVAAIESLLREHKDTFLSDPSLQIHLAGDHIWNPNAGWGVVKCVDGSAKKMDAYLHLRGETKSVVKKNFYINLRLAADKIPELKHWVAQACV
jgi:HKD family nuclease